MPVVEPTVPTVGNRRRKQKRPDIDEIGSIPGGIVASGGFAGNAPTGSVATTTATIGGSVVSDRAGVLPGGTHLRFGIVDQTVHDAVVEQPTRGQRLGIRLQHMAVEHQSDQLLGSEFDGKVTPGKKELSIN